MAEDNVHGQREFQVKSTDPQDFLKTKQEHDAMRDAKLERDAQAAQVPLVANVQPTEVDELLPKQAEVVDEIEFQLPNGLIVEMRRPRIALAFLIGAIYANQPPMDASRATAKAIMHCVTKRREGEEKTQIPIPKTLHELVMLSNEFGDDGTDLIQVMYAKYFMPVIDLDNLPVLKKNLRRP